MMVILTGRQEQVEPLRASNWLSWDMPLPHSGSLTPEVQASSLSDFSLMYSQPITDLHKEA